MNDSLHKFHVFTISDSEQKVFFPISSQVGLAASLQLKEKRLFWEFFDRAEKFGECNFASLTIWNWKSVYIDLIHPDSSSPEWNPQVFRRLLLRRTSQFSRLARPSLLGGRKIWKFQFRKFPQLPRSGRAVLGRLENFGPPKNLFKQKWKQLAQAEENVVQSLEKFGPRFYKTRTLFLLLLFPWAFQMQLGHTSFCKQLE